jgi:hypothetical protein
MANYPERAKQHFLEGLNFESPIAAIAAGARTMHDWCETLEHARLGLPLPTYAGQAPSPVDPEPTFEEVVTAIVTPTPAAAAKLEDLGIDLPLFPRAPQVETTAVGQPPMVTQQPQAARKRERPDRSKSARAEVRAHRAEHLIELGYPVDAKRIATSRLPFPTEEREHVLTRAERAYWRAREMNKTYWGRVNAATDARVLEVLTDPKTVQQITGWTAYGETRVRSSLARLIEQGLVETRGFISCTRGAATRYARSHSTKQVEQASDRRAA